MSQLRVMKTDKNKFFIIFFSPFLLICDLKKNENLDFPLDENASF